MSLISKEKAREIETSNQNRINKQLVDGPVYDRWSIVFILIVLSIIAFFIIANKGSLKYAFVPLVASSITGLIVASSGARIRRNDFEGLMYYKGESDCGFSAEVKNNIDGLIIDKRQFGRSQKRMFKATNGSDLVIDKHGNITYAGFGSKLISGLRNDGYLNEAPDKCWEIK